jgi:RHS repeat-associated protein
VSGLSLPRGYSGHEHLDHLGLIHMNGRVYDPEIGRFISADPYVQFPESTQGFNRYTYVANNPLSYTDPSGYVVFAQTLRGRLVLGLGVIAKGARAGGELTGIRLPYR